MRQAGEHPIRRQPRQMGARLAQSNAFEECIANGKADANEVIQSHVCGDDVPSQRPVIQLQASRVIEFVDLLRLDERNLLIRLRGRRSGERADACVVSVTGDSTTRFQMREGHGLHGCPGNAADVDRKHSSVHVGEVRQGDG